MWSSGDPDQNPLHLLVRFITAIIVMVLFRYGYNLFIAVMGEFLNAILDTMKQSFPDMLSMIQSNMLGGIFTAIMVLIIVILWLMLCLQLVIKGAEMLVLRCGVPLSAVGLLNSDKGSFSLYLKEFISNSLTVIVQLALTNFAILILSNRTFNICNSFFNASVENSSNIAKVLVYSF